MTFSECYGFSKYVDNTTNREFFRPNIPIKITNPDTGLSHTTYALLDTGADDILFPKGIAEETGHNLKGSGVISTNTTGVSGHPISTWKHSYIISILSKDLKHVLWTSEKILVDCCGHDSIPPLLGFHGFLSNFIIEFDYVSKTIVIKD